MGRPRGIRSAVPGAAMLLLLAACTSPLKVRLLYTDVWNGRVVAEEAKGARGESLWVGGGPLATSVFERAREQSRRDGRIPLFLNVGGSLLGSREAWFTQGQAPLAFMNLIGFHAMAVSNRDFDLGVPALHELARQSRFPFLAANLETEKGETPKFARSHVVLSAPEGVTIGITALMSAQMENTIQKSSFRGLRLRDPFKAFADVMAHPDFRNATLRILILNAGSELPESFRARLAREVTPHVALVVRRNWASRAVTGPETLGGVPVLQAPPFWHGVGEYAFDYSKEENKVVDAKWRMLKVDSASVEPDPRAARRLVEVRTELESALAQVHGVLTEPLPHLFSEESPFGSFVCDILQEETQSDVALFNSGGLRGHADPTVTAGSLFQAIPFDNFVVQLRLSGQELKELLEESASRALSRNGIVQVSRNLQVRFDLSRPQGKRVVEARVGGRLLEGKRSYLVAANDFLAEGGDGFGVFQVTREMRTLNVRVREAVARHVERTSPVTWKWERRLQGLSAQEGKK